MIRIILQATCLFFTSTSVWANGGKAPKGHWKCAYSGDEWRQCRSALETPPNIPDPVDPCIPGARPTTWQSDWHADKEDAIDQAFDRCDSRSITHCEFESCRQKK